MARLGFVDQEGNVSHITSSYTPKKKKKEEEVKVNDNKSTDIRTVKTGKNLIDDAKIIKKGVDTGIISGLTGVADAPFQAAQEEIQKGKNIKSEKELLKDAALGILRASSPLANSILGNRETSNEIKKTLKDKDKSTLEKIVNSGLAVVGNEALDNTYQGAKAALRIGGAINPNLDKTVSNIQSFIDKPAETKQQELSQEIQDYSSPVQFLTTAGQTIGNMLPSIGATAITKDPSAGLSLMGVSAKGQATKEALQNGADITQANRIGTAKGLLEVGTELATGGLNIFGKGALDDITTNFINKKIGSKGLNFLAKQIAGVGGEIGEELVSDVVGTLIDRGTIDPNADYSSKEAKETILQTIATTLLLNGLTGGYTPRAYRQNAIEMQESRQNNGNVLNNNDTVIPDTNQVREVNEIQQKVENGEITYEEANQQMEQVQNGTYQQNQNNQVVIQEAQKQFDAINQAEANGIMDSETANQERQAIINTMNQMQQDTNTQENGTYEPQEVQEEKRQSPIDKLSDEEKEQLNTIYQKQANREQITDQDRKTLEYFTRKTNDLKNPELNKNITKFDDVKSGYKYVKNFDESKFDSTMVDKAKDIVSANKQGRRTKQQWLDVAKNIGMQADNLDSKALEKLAFESWAYTRPNQRGVLNRQGAQKVDFQIHEWVKAIYEGARVGERIESRVESPKIQVNQEAKKTQTKEVETKKTQEPSLKNAKQYYNRNLGKYTPGDAFESAIGEYQLRPEEAENLRDYTIKKYPDYAEEINRRYNDLYNQEETTKIEEQTKEEAKIETPKVEEEPVEKIETKEQKQEYFKDNGVNEEGAKFLSEMPKPDKLSIRERIKQGKARRAEQWAWFKRNVVDKGEEIYTLAKKLKNPLLYAKYDKRGTTTGEANYDIGEGQTNLKGKKYKNFKYVDKNGKVVRTGPMSLNQIWEGIDPAVGNEYIGHWLNVDRYKQTSSEGKKIIAQLEADVKAGKMTKQEMEEELKNYNTNRYVISPNFTDEMSKKKIAELEEAHPELKVFGENVWQYGKNQLQNMLDAGMISEQQAKQWQKETPHYVRLQRNIPNNTQSTIVFDDKGNARVSNQIKEFKGSTLDVLPFKDSMAAYTLDVRNSIRENAFAQELAKSLGVSSNNQEITDINDIMGFNPELLDNGNGTYSLTFLNKGVPTTMPITQGIYEALQPNKHYEWENKPFFEDVRKVDSIRKALLTDKNPMFLATNMMKDLFDAPLNSKYPVSFAKNYPKAIWQVVKNGELYQQYKALGGLQNTYFEKSDGFKKPSKLDVIGRMNNAIEQFPRVAEFMSTMEKTGDVDQAMYNAAEITTNFKRGGDVAKAINRNGFTFLNASIQGFSKQIRNFTDISNPKEATKMLLKALILGVAPALINDAGWGDDEDYQELQDYQKDRYYIIGKTKDGTFIRIPKGRAVSVFQSAARRTKYALGGDKKAFNGFVKFAQDQVAPNNPLDNNLVSPLVNVYRNTSWSGNDIIPQSMMEYTKTEDQFNEKTDVVSRKIGKALGKLPELPEGFENFKSPMGINYLIDQYSGALGDVTLPYITPKASSKTTNPILKPIRDKFTGDFAYSNKNVNTFYEVQKELKKKSDTPVEDAKSSYMISQGKELSKLYTKQREIQNNNKLSKSEKYEKAREVQKEINEFAKKSVKDINNVDENKYYLKIGDKYFKRVIKDGEEQYVVDTSKKIPTEKYALYDYFKSKYEKSKEGKK